MKKGITYGDRFREWWILQWLNNDECKPCFSVFHGPNAHHDLMAGLKVRGATNIGLIHVREVLE